MRLARFDHINLLTSDIDGMRDFLMSVLGVKPGWRPPFRSPGYWLYAGEDAIFHVSDASNHEQTHVDDIGAVQTGGRSTVDHICFRCEGYRQTVDRLRELGVTFHEEDVPYARDRQIFVDGPDNITFELLFAPADVEAGGGTPVASGTRR
jgi:catechol 2,3-dioxygenase-like lactoylglutathione lyase family enzyme